MPIIFCLFLALDQISKFAVQANLRLNESVEIIPGLFNLTYALNPGAAFGILRGQSETFRILFFVGMTVLACVLIFALIVREYHYKLRTFAYTAVMAGALGNMIDRLRIGKVVDFLDFYFKSWRWYTFNIADSFITVSIAILIIDLLLLNKGEKNG